MAMSRKHYEAIAEDIRLAKNSGSASGTSNEVARIVMALCETFLADNPNFDGPKFITACGVSDVVGWLDDGESMGSPCFLGN